MCRRDRGRVLRKRQFKRVIAGVEGLIERVVTIRTDTVSILLGLDHDTRVTLHIIVLDVSIEAGDAGGGLLRKLKTLFGQVDCVIRPHQVVVVAIHPGSCAATTRVGGGRGSNRGTVVKEGIPLDRNVLYSVGRGEGRILAVEPYVWFGTGAARRRVVAIERVILNDDP